MSIGWFLLSNGILGAILYVPLVYIFRWFCYKKFGEETSNKGYTQELQDSEDMTAEIAEATHQGRRGYSFLMALNWMETIFLWEISLPFKFWRLYTQIKYAKEQEEKNEDKAQKDNV